MAREPASGAGRRGPDLSAFLRPLFWEYNFKALTGEADRNLIIARVLASGSWEAVTWLRSRVSNAVMVQMISSS